MSLINREDLIAEYDRVHVGEPGGARKLMVDAPEVQPDRMKLVQQAVNTIMSTSRSYSIRDRAFRNAARLVQCAIDGEAPDFEQIPEGDEMPSEPHWIPFDEQQPEYGQQILVTIHWHESGEEEYFVQQDVYFDDATLNSNFKIGRDVFAWMPLPEPYREEGEK